MNHVRPSRVRLEATSVCQLRCPDCPTASGATKPVLKTGYLGLNSFRALVDRNPHVIHVELSNYGELFLNPDLAGIMEYAFRRGVQLTADNGANLNTVREEVLEALVKYRFRRITCSIDGASAETYARYRVRGDFGVVIENIRTINRYKQQYGSRYPILDWQFIVFPHNRHEVAAARSLAGELDMGFTEKLPWKDEAPPAEATDPPGLAEEPASRGAYLERYGNIYKQEICRQLWRMPQVNWDGRMLGCCRNFWGEFGGNVFEDGLEQAANSERMQYARDMLTGQRPPRADIPCTTCDLYLERKRRGLWVTSHERALPASVLDYLIRHRIHNRMMVGLAAAATRAAEAAYFGFARARRALRSRG